MEPRVLSTAADVTDDVLEAAIETFDDWFDNDEPIDWESFIDRLADPTGCGKAGAIEFDKYDNPAIRKIQRHVRAYRNQG
jgi:hypothetical protein